jgi:hypothetical protein
VPSKLIRSKKNDQPLAVLVLLNCLGNVVERNHFVVKRLRELFACSSANVMILQQQQLLFCMLNKVFLVLCVGAAWSKHTSVRFSIVSETGNRIIPMQRSTPFLPIASSLSASLARCEFDARALASLTSQCCEARLAFPLAASFCLLSPC